MCDGTPRGPESVNEANHQNGGEHGPATQLYRQPPMPVRG